MPECRDRFNGFGPGIFLLIFVPQFSAAAADLQLLGTHPTSPLTAFPTIHILKAYEGRIYMGYGNWNLYPAITMVSYDPSNGVFCVEHSTPSDSIGMMREIRGELFVPSIDPPHYQGFRDFAVRSQGHWRTHAPAGMLHVFDLTTANGTDLWFVGSKTPNETLSNGAAVFRSTDGGRSWTDLTLSSSLARYYYCFTLRGKVYVQDTVFDGSVRTRVSLPYGFLHKATPVQATEGEEIIVGLTGLPPGIGLPERNWLVTFDGNSWRTLKTDVYDLTVSDGGLYTLEYNPVSLSNEVSVATFISASQMIWQKLPLSNVPNAKAIEVLNGTVYIGDAQGRLWAGRVDGTGITVQPATTNVALPDAFGQALSIAGNTLAVGAPDFSGTNIMDGQVTIWETADPRSGHWSIAHTIDPPAGSFSGWFGKDVAIADGLLAILEAGRDLSGQDRGSAAQVHLFEYTGGTWERRQTLNRPYAHSVAVRSDLLVVGSSTNLFIYNLTNGAGGAAAVLATNLRSALLDASIYEPAAQVALDGNVVAWGISGDFSRSGGPGQVSLYESDPAGVWRSLTNLSQRSQPLPLRPDAFGFAVALKGDWLAVGAPREDRGALQAGAVHLYQRTTNAGVTSYVLRQTLFPACPEPEANFGSALSLTDSNLIVGMPGAANGSTFHHGAVLVYGFDGVTWVLKGRVAPPAGTLSGFGTELACADNRLLAGSFSSFASSNLVERVAIRRLPEDMEPAPAILAQPISYTVSPGARAEFTVAAAGQGDLTYQWKRNNTNVSTERDLIIDPVRSEHAGIYTVAVSDRGFCIESAPAVLSLLSVRRGPLSVRLSIIGPVQQRYRLDYSDDLAGPNPWRLLTNFALPISPYAPTDRSSTGVSQRFYRLVPVP